MINTPTIISSDLSILGAGKNSPGQEILYSFIIDADFQEKLSLQTLSDSVLLQADSNHFSFYLDFEKHNQDLLTFFELLLKKKKKLLNYFFLPEYKLIDESPVICFNKKYAESKDVKEFILKLENYIKLQGYQGIKQIHFSDAADSSSNISFTEVRSADKITAEYLNLLKSNYYTSKHIGIGPVNIEDSLNALKAAENELLKSDPLLFDLLTNMMQTESLASSLNAELRMANEDLNNQKIYLKIFRDQDEALKINQFYHNEYEILPSWYKKLGHLIKVLTGKRSFNSLFDNNVKKYKN